jgi:hypothetical protein
MTNKFNTLFEQLLTELTPVDADAGSFSSSLGSSIDSAPGDGYLIGTVAKALNISKKQASEKVATSLYKKLFTDGRNDASSEDEYREAISYALSDVIAEIKAENPEAKIPTAAAQRGYTARVISKLATATKDFSGLAASPVQVDRAIIETESEEGSDDVETDTEAEDAVIETVYQKAADCDSDDAQLVKMWKKIPDDADLSWSQLLRYVGMTNANELLTIGAILEVEREVNTDSEDSKVGELDFDDTTDEIGPLSDRRIHKELGSDMYRTKSPYANSDY